MQVPVFNKFWGVIFLLLALLLLPLYLFEFLWKSLRRKKNDWIRHYLKRWAFIFRQIYGQDVQKIQEREVSGKREGRFVKRRVQSTVQNVSPSQVPREKSRRP